MLEPQVDLKLLTDVTRSAPHPLLVLALGILSERGKIFF